MKYRYVCAFSCVIKVRYRPSLLRPMFFSAISLTLGPLHDCRLPAKQPRIMLVDASRKRTKTGDTTQPNKSQRNCVFISWGEVPRRGCFIVKDTGHVLLGFVLWKLSKTYRLLVDRWDTMGCCSSGLIQWHWDNRQ